MTADPIVTPDDLQRYQDGDAFDLLGQATGAVRDYCKWHITPTRTETVTLRALPYTRGVFLPSLNVTAVTSVTMSGSVADPTTYSWTAAGVLWSDSWWGYTSTLWGQQQDVTVTFTHGFPTAEAVGGVILARASRFQNNDRSATQLRAGPFGESYESGGGFTSDERAILDRYRLPVMA